MEFESLFQIPNFTIVNGSGVTIPGLVLRAGTGRRFRSAALHRVRF